MKQTPLSEPTEDEKFDDKRQQKHLTEDEPLSQVPAAPISIEGLPKAERQVDGRTYEEDDGSG